MTRTGVALGSLLLLLCACGSETGAPTIGGPDPASPPSSGAAASPTATTTGGPVISGTGIEAPPPFRLRYDDHELVLMPHTWCYDSGCVDGFSEHPPSIGSPASVQVFVPVEGWELSASFTPADRRCGRYQTVTPTEDDGWYLLEPAGHAGSYDVHLFAHGGGDMAAVFRWTTPVDGELPTPEATMALIANHDGRPDSYGVELTLANLAETPDSARATVTVTAANGESLTFEADRDGRRCMAEGTVFFGGPDAQGQAAAALGGFPFRYEIEVRLDGTTYHASADYPGDEIDGNEPSVALEFNPPLPAMR